MALKGDLRNVSLFDVFQTLSQNRQSGVLVLQRHEITRKVHVSPEGVFLARSFRPMRLGEIFVRRGYLTHQDIEILLLEQKDSQRPIGELMVESGKVPQEEIERLLNYHAEDEIYELFTWDSGTFAFYDSDSVGPPPSTGLARIKLDPAQLCIEAARRIDEMARLRAVIPTNDEFYVQVEGQEPDPEQSGPIVCEVFALLAEPHSVDELRDLACLSLFDALGIVVNLLEAGLIRALELDELVEAGRAERARGDHRRAALFFERAHARKPEDRQVLEECIDAVGRLQDPRRLARLLSHLGRIQMASGEGREAVESLEQALRQDPENTFILHDLRDAHVGVGDEVRAAETSLHLARILSQAGNLDEAADVCYGALERSPQHVALRYVLGQLLAQADRTTEAQQILYALAREAESLPRSRRGKKTYELVTGCYRLLVKLDPHDEAAQTGLRRASRLRVSALRRRRLLVRAGIAVGLLLIAGVIGLTIRGQGAEALFAELEQAHRAGDAQRVISLAGTLAERFPGTEETEMALALRAEMRKSLADEQAERRKREAALREEIDGQLEELRTALEQRPYLEALGLVRPLLDRIEQRDYTFLRKQTMALAELEVGTFIERVTEQFERDRQQIALIEHRLRSNVQGWRDHLPQFEESLAEVRSRRWPQTAPEMDLLLQDIVGGRDTGRFGELVQRFRDLIESAGGGFVNLDALYYSVRCARLEKDIDDAVAIARTRGRDLLRTCRFAEARALYADAYRRAQDVDLEEPREAFLDLLRKLERSNTRSEMHQRLEEIDHVVNTLTQVERLRAARDAAAAFRMFRPLVDRFRLIQFETRYTMPYQVLSTPRGAEISINGKVVGKAPLAVELGIIQRADIVASRPGFAPERVELMPTDPKLTGELLFSLRKNVAWQREVSGQVEAAPVPARDLLLLATSNASLLALRLADGGIAWEARTGLLDRIPARPIVDGDHAVLVTGGGRMVRVRLKDGHIESGMLLLPGEVHGDPARDGDTIYVATMARRLVAVRDQRIVYDQPLAYSPATHVLFAGGLLFVGTAEGVILVHDARTGEERGRLTTPTGSSFFGGIAVHRDLVVGGAEDGTLYAFGATSGKLAWKYPTAGPVTAPATSDGEHLYLPASDGYVHALDSTGTAIVRYEMVGIAACSPAVANGFLYAVGGSRLTAFDAQDAKAERAWWEFSFPAELGAPLHVVDGGDVVIVVTKKAQVLAFPRDER